MFKERNYEKTNCRINDGFIREYDDLAYHFGIKLSSYCAKQLRQDTSLSNIEYI